jgi:acetyl esterase
MGLSYEEKLELAKMARVRVGHRELPESYAAYLEKVDVKECELETRHGKTYYYHIINKEQKTGVPLVISIHGGGFCKGYVKADTAFSAMLAVETGAVVLDVDYKLAPEHAFPIAIEEVYDVAKWAYENADELGIDTSKIIIGGNSSGANIAAAVAMEVTKTKEFEIRLQVLDYPPMDLYTDPADKPEASKSYVPFEQARAYNSLYTETEEETKNPYVSMVFASRDMLIGLPEALVITGDLDALHNETEKYAFMMMEAGVKVTIKKFLNSNHGFIVHCIGDEWQQAHKLIVDTINNL